MEPIESALTASVQAHAPSAPLTAPLTAPLAAPAASSAASVSVVAPKAHVGLPRTWRPAPLYWVAGGVHVAGALTWLARPSLWPWVLGAMALDHAVNFGFSFVPGSSMYGPCISTLPPQACARGEIALTFDDGPDPDVTPRILDLLDARAARATFFCVGEQARKQSRLLREIVARGHAVENHSLAHSPAYGFYGPRRLRREIDTAQQLLTDLAQVAPLYYRAPYGVRTPMTEPVLSALGLHCVAWSVRSLDTVDRNQERIVRRVTRRLAAGAIVLLHDRAAGRQWTQSVVLSVLPALLEEIARRDLRAVTLRAALCA